MKKYQLSQRKKRFLAFAMACIVAAMTFNPLDHYYLEVEANDGTNCNLEGLTITLKNRDELINAVQQSGDVGGGLIYWLNGEASATLSEGYSALISSSEMSNDELNSADFGGVPIDIPEFYTGYIYVKASNGQIASAEIRYDAVINDISISVADPTGSEVTDSGDVYGGRWYVTTPAVQLMVDDSGADGSPVTILYRIYKEGTAKGDYQTYNSEIQIPEGKQVLEYYAKDTAGNSTNVSTKKFYVDTSIEGLRVAATTGDGQTYRSGTYTNSEVTVFIADNDGNAVDLGSQAGLKVYFLESEAEILQDPVEWGEPSSQSSKVFTVDGYNKYCHVKVVNTVTGREFVDTIRVRIDKTAPKTPSCTIKNQDDSDAQTKLVNGEMWYTSRIKFSLTKARDDQGDDTVSLMYRYYKVGTEEANKGNYLEYNAGDTGVSINEGKWILQYYAVDMAGNISSEEPIEKQVYIDESGVNGEPVIEAKKPDDTTYVDGTDNNQDITLYVKASDQMIKPIRNQVGMFYYLSDTELDESALSHLESDAWESVDNTGKIKIQAVDGNVLDKYCYIKVDKFVTCESWIKSIHVNIDKEAPSIENIVTLDQNPGEQQVENHEGYYWYDENPNLTIQLLEQGGSIAYKLYKSYPTAEEPENYSIASSNVVKKLGDGQWILKYYVTDKAGNKSDEKVTYYYVDSQLTSVSMKTILNDNEAYSGGYSNQSVKFSAVSSDGTVYKTNGNIEVYYDLGEGSWETLGNDTGVAEISDTALFNQSCKIKVINTNTGREIVSEPVQIMVDTKAPESAPTLSVSSEPNGGETEVEGVYGGKWYQDSTPTLSFEALQDDGGSPLHIEYRLYKEGESAGEFTTYETSVDQPVLSESGKWALEYKTVDAAGNESSTTTTKFYIDKKPSLMFRVKDASGNAYTEGENTSQISFDIQNTSEGIGTKYYVYESTKKCTQAELKNGNIAWTQISGNGYVIDESKLKDGSHFKKYFYLKAESTGDRTLYDIKEQYIFVDRKKPDNASVEIKGDSKAQGWYYTLPEINMTSPQDDGTDITTYFKLYLSSDSEPGYTVLSTQYQPKITKDGQYILKYYTKDGAGNVSEEKSQTINYDGTLPTQPKIEFTTKNSSLLAKIINFVSFKYFCKESIAVNMSSEDITSGVESLTYYTEQNGVKSEEKTILDAAGVFYLDPGFKGKVYVSAKDRAGNVTTYSISDGVVYDNVNAEITINSQDNDQWISGEVALDIIAQDKVDGIKKIACTINDQAVYEKEFTDQSDVTYMEQFRVTATEEAVSVAGYKVVVTVEDNAGNISTKEKMVYIDKTAPVVQLSGIEAGSYHNKTTTLNTKVTDQIYQHVSTSLHVERTLDGVTSEYDIKGAAMTGIESSENFAFDQDGSYQITVTAEDAAGNKAVVQKISFVVDKTAPVIEITGPTEGSYSMSDVETSIKVTESFYDTDEVSIKVTRELDGKVSDYPLKGWSNTGKESVLRSAFAEDGTYSIQVEAKDSAGNKAVIKTLTFTVDKTAPELSISGADDYQISSHDITLHYNVTESYFETNNVVISLTKEDIDGNKSEVNVGSWVNRGKESSLNYQITSDGIYTAKIIATDKAGNKAEIQKTVTVDTKDPVIRYIDGIDGQYYQSFVLPYDVNEMIQDLTVPSYELFLNSDEYDGVTEVTDEGKYVLKVEVEDEAGHSANAKAEFIVDNTAPNILITGVEDKATYYEAVSPVISLTGSEDIIQEILVDGDKQEFDAETMEYENTISSIGSHEISVMAVDYAGNKTEQLISFEIKNKSVFRKWYENTPLFVASIAIALGGGAGGVAFFGVRRKKLINIK